MRTLLVAALAVSLVGLIGCGKPKPPATGSSIVDTKVAGPTKVTPEPTGKDKPKAELSFDLPADGVELKKDTKDQEVTIKIKRTEVPGEVALVLDAKDADGITLKDKEVKIPADKSEVVVKLDTTPDAKGGVIAITGAAGEIKTEGKLKVAVK